MNQKKFLATSLTDNETSPCDDWHQYKDEKCFLILDNNMLFTFEEAKELCKTEAEGSSLIVIHSMEELEFLSEYLFESQGIANEVWIGLKKFNDKYKWVDDSPLEFNNWAKGSPSYRQDNNCVQMFPRANRLGEWVDKPCSRKNIAVCQRLQVLTLASIQRALLEAKRQFNDNKQIIGYTLRQLNDIRDMIVDSRGLTNGTAVKSNDSKFNIYLKNLFSNKWINYRLFTETDGKQKAFFIPLNENKDRKTWDEATAVCATYNSSLVEIDSWQKHLVFTSFMGQLGILGHILSSFWLNGQKDYSGQWKWMTSGNEITYFDWFPSYPKNDKYFDYLAVQLEGDENFCKFFNSQQTNEFHVVCETDVDF